MARHGRKITHAAHVKRSTQGTSNELSFSVLDAARESLEDSGRRDAGRARPRGRARGGSAGGGGGALAKLGAIPLFTLGRRRKTMATPERERGLMLPGGTFVSTEGDRDAALPSGPVHSAARPGLGRAAAAGLSPSRPALGAPRGSSWQAPAEEVARRKTLRKRRRLAVLAAGTAAVLVLAAFLGTMGYSLIQAQKALRGDLSVALGDIQRADEAIIPMDQLVAARINDGVGKGDAEAIAADWEALQPQVDQALVDLDAARRDVEAVQSKLVDARDKEAANRALIAVNARVNMIGAGRELMAEAVPARRAQQAADTAWERTLEGDGLARDAAAALSSMTKDTVNQSMALSEQALAAFTAARDGLESAAEAYPDADFSAFVSYLNLRIDAQYAAIASDKAYLDRDKTAMAEQNARYNELDAQAVEAARALEGDPTGIVGPLYTAAAKDKAAAYSSERLQAGDADAFLRDYLGSLGK